MFCVSAKAAKGRQRHTSEGSRQQAMAAVTAQPSTPQLQPNNSAAAQGNNSAAAQHDLTTAQRRSSRDSASAHVPTGAAQRRKAV